MALVIKIRKQSAKKQLLSQNVVFFVFHQIRSREKREEGQSDGLGILTLLKLITDLFITSGIFYLCVLAEL